MPRFRKKPVVIDAVRWEGSRSVADVVIWRNALSDDVVHQWRFEGDRAVIPTPEGDMTASPGDWIIRGVKGEFYPCKPDIFETTYEPVD